jgi:hypothetical protein
MPDTLKMLQTYCTADRRICPMPAKWAEFHALLGKVDGEAAPPPLILAAWHIPHLPKIIRLDEQLVWAKQHGKLSKAERFLRALKDDEWFRAGDV